MNVLKLYHSMPHSIRNIIASSRGFYLRWSRYGFQIEKLIDEVLERDYWTDSQWQEWQQETLAQILHRAVNKVPYYRNYWNQQKRNGNKASWEELENWPILTKQTLRDNAKAFVAEDCQTRWMFCNTTSGTTGSPLKIYFQRSNLKKVYAIHEARLRRWHGVSIKQKWAIMGGQLVVPFSQKRPPFWVHNAGLNQLYLSTHHISNTTAKYYVEILQKYQPTNLIVYPSSAVVLASAMLENGLSVEGIKVVFSNAELLLDTHREIISQAFRCPVVNTYGMAEAVGGASECPEGSFHIFSDEGIIEVLEDDTNVPTQGVGRLILTGLINPDMPLIRYEVGDRGSIDLKTKCKCGRNLPILSANEGRLNDLVITKDNRKIFWLNPVFYNLPIHEAQIIQEDRDNIRIKYVPTADFSKDVKQKILSRLEERVGSFTVVLEEVKQIPRQKNGKFKAVICKIT